MSNELTFLVAFATVFGASEAIKHIQSDARRKEHRSRKNNLIVRCLKSCEYSPYLEGRRVVLSGEKLYIDTGTHHAAEFGHPFAGYYLPYPDSKASGLVSTISDEPPVMNWIYVDRWSYELKFGNRSWADDNFPIPWDCSRQDRRLTFGGWEGFLAVKEGNFWGLYFDVDGDGLKSKVEEGTPVLEIELLRVEMRLPKPLPPPPPEIKDKEEKAEDGTADANAAQGGDGANGEANGQAEQQTGQQAGQQEQPQPQPQQQLEQQPEKQPGEAGQDKANGSTYPKGTYVKPTVEEEEEPLESPAVD
ncbi:hypothetical protein F5B22DRAFT_509351 [Xylaria bambusicola]|uniref:uncharacterized protein n=1 Tax=Xylaria bambusicola TaxID=326684 RepID=UPI00200747A7|nr:uncharacterized protein F5B22DRAFT_509351 [Xylaria bambusicola]KAI0521901.1 hypothetical protein F5B22DRAFT_509351 [Xylaria bambusicola]